MPSRVVREGINSSERINSLSVMAELAYRRLLNVADDHARYWTDLDVLRLNLFPLERSVNPKTGATRVRPSKKYMRQIFSEWRESQLITVYGSGRYMLVHKFRQQYRSKSKFPDPVDLAPDKQKLGECYAKDKQILSLVGVGVGDVVEVERAAVQAEAAPAPLASVSSVASQPVVPETPKPAPAVPPAPVVERSDVPPRIPVAEIVRNLAGKVTLAGNNTGSVVGDLKSALSLLYRRPPEQAWSYAEETLLVEIARRPDAKAEFQLIANFRRGMPLEERKKFFPQQVARLLENWNGTLDRARMAKPVAARPAVSASITLPKPPPVSDEQRARMAAQLREMMDRATTQPAPDEKAGSNPS